MNEINVVLVSFADSRWEPTLNRLKSQAYKSEFFNQFHLYNEKNLDKEFYLKHNHILQKKGFGYWIWKSFITMKVLNELNDGDILIYIDAGCHINSLGKTRFYEYINMLKNDITGILTFCGSGKEYEWTKGDVFDHFDARNNQLIYSTGQIYAGCFIIKKCAISLSIVNEWHNTCTNYIHLVDESSSISKNFDGFIENRFDQSIFSIITKKYNCPQVTDSEVYNYGKKWDDMKQFPFQARRDKSMKLSAYLLHRLSSPKRIFAILFNKLKYIYALEK